MTDAPTEFSPAWKRHALDDAGTKDQILKMLQKPCGIAHLCDKFSHVCRGIGMKLGYARVSTEDHHLDLQRTRLKEGGCGKLFEEKISGAARQGPALERLLQDCAPRISWS